MNTVILILGLLAMFLYLHFCGSQKRPVKAMLVNSAAGVLALMAAAVISGIMGVGIAVNYASVWAAVTLGVPGVIGVVLVMFVI